MCQCEALRAYLQEGCTDYKGKQPGNLWIDIPRVSSKNERTAYLTIIHEGPYS